MVYYVQRKMDLWILDTSPFPAGIFVSLSIKQYLER
jgi:hypothetical protein